MAEEPGDRPIRRERGESPAVRARRGGAGAGDGEPPADRGDGGAAGEAPRPWHRNPLVWTIVVVVLVLAALGVSILAGTDPRDPELADVDHTEMCAAARSFRSLLGSELDPTSDVGQVRQLSEGMRAIERAAPDTIRVAAKDWADGLFDAARKIDIVLAQPSPSGTIPDYDEVFAIIERVATEKSDAIDRVTNYVRKACGIDLDQPVTDPAAGDTAPVATATTAAPAASPATPVAAP